MSIYDKQFDKTEREEEFFIHNRVRKKKGYAFPGTVVAKFATLKGLTRYVVECEVPEVSGILHIYSGKDLEFISQDAPNLVEVDNRKIIYNGLRTPDGTLLVSRHRHDYQVHVDTTNGKRYKIDGGNDYIHSSYNRDEEYVTYYDDTPHETQREILTWGTRGRNGDQPVTQKAIKDMETAHIEAVLETCEPAKHLRECMENELDFRRLWS